MEPIVILTYVNCNELDKTQNWKKERWGAVLVGGWGNRQSLACMLPLNPLYRIHSPEMQCQVLNKCRDEVVIETGQAAQESWNHPWAEIRKARKALWFLPCFLNVFLFLFIQIQEPPCPEVASEAVANTERHLATSWVGWWDWQPSSPFPTQVSPSGLWKSPGLTVPRHPIFEICFCCIGALFLVLLCSYL